MSNWIINIEHMLLVNVAVMRVSKIKYVPEENMVYYHWKSGSYDGWDTCVPEIIEEYLKQINIVSEKILLEE